MDRSTLLVHDLKKYFRYFFETRGFTSDNFAGAISQDAIRTAALARGNGRGPAIFIQGIMPRSGTVYIGELLCRHPDLYAYPHHLWELPMLPLTADIRQLQQKFMLGYKMNEGKLQDDDFLPLIGAAMMAHLHAPAPQHQRVLAKMPSVQYLSQFFSMFPHENVLVLVRDGRDVVHSTLRTWTHLNFIQVSLLWNRSAKSVLYAMDHFEKNHCHGYWMTKYEDALQDPVSFAQEACRRFGLDESRYPFEEIDKIRVIGSSKLEEKGKVGWRHIKRPQNFRPVEYWSKWPLVKKSVFKVIAGQSLIDLGYCEDMKW
ncbi:MAG: sulfotransferase [Ardenticatenaceae bacterium]|nr:sulfotransferase [Ardenticatenaceae bacterium]